MWALGQATGRPRRCNPGPWSAWLWAETHCWWSRSSRSGHPQILSNKKQGPGGVTTKQQHLKTSQNSKMRRPFYTLDFIFLFQNVIIIPCWRSFLGLLEDQWKSGNYLWANYPSHDRQVASNEVRPGHLCLVGLFPRGKPDEAHRLAVFWLVVFKDLCEGSEVTACQSS